LNLINTGHPTDSGGEIELLPSISLCVR